MDVWWHWIVFGIGLLILDMTMGTFFILGLGGLALFGIMGFVIGPIIAALFITMWEIYGRVFKDILPEVGPIVESIKKKKKKIPQNDKGNQK